MLTAKRRRTTWAVAASAIAHLVVVVIVALQRPMLNMPVEAGGPPLPAIIPVLLVPRVPAAGKLAKPEPIRLHRRPQPFVPPEIKPAPIAPPAPPAQPAPATARAAPPTFHPAPLPEGPKGDVRTALRQGPVGCANPMAVGLNKAERDLCDEKFGKGVATATPYATGMELTAEKKRLLDAQAAQKDADILYKRGTAGAAPPPSSYGQSAEDMCKNLGIPPEKCGARR